MRIQARAPGSPYKCELDTEVMDVVITNAFKGATFVSPDGEILRVSMRDSGFEVGYSADFGDQGFDAGTTSFQNGVVTPAIEKTSDEKPESNLVNHARRELELIGEDSEWVEGMCKVVQTFADMGHSGGSASFFVPVLYELLQFNNLSPLTNDPKEWNNVGDGVWQSARNSEAFSNDGGKTYYLLSELKEDAEAPLHTTVQKEGVPR